MPRRRPGLARRLPVGAEVQPGGGTHFRVWAPGRRLVAVVGEGETPFEEALQAEEGGYFSGLVEPAAAGTRYRFRLDGEDSCYPDPASRFQPEGPHGPSQVVDPDFSWTDTAWRGVRIEGQVIYELHVGTFTRPGTWAAAAQELAELAAAGITLVEVMPVAEFPGRFGWGYDGVDLFAPSRLYGEPDDLRRFVDRAHAEGIGVVLDVVYNHLGPDGNFLRQFSEAYFSTRYTTDWGDAINFDGEGAEPVREFFAANAAYWVREFHLDGLRVDATQNICDASPEHILGVITAAARAAAIEREIVVIAENEPQHTRLVRPPEAGGFGLDALWNDDFHHSAIVALTARNEAYYTDYRGAPQEFVSAAKWGYLYQGQRYTWQGKRRGTPAFGLRPAQFVNFTENHDQIANSGHGLRTNRLTSPAQHKAMTALLLLAPGTPMLFQGQEFAASTPFFYFADYREDLARSVQQGRAEFLAQFRSLAVPEMQARLPDPGDPQTFVSSKLDLTERVTHAAEYAFHRDLLRLRREDPAFAAQRPGGVDGAVLGPDAFVLRFFLPPGDEPLTRSRAEGDGVGAAPAGDRLLLVNLGLDLHLDPAPEPLLAPPEGMEWSILWSSEDPRYGGLGTAPLDGEANWRIPGRAAVVLAPAPLPPGGEEGAP